MEGTEFAPESNTVSLNTTGSSLLLFHYRVLARGLRICTVYSLKTNVGDTEGKPKRGEISGLFAYPRVGRSGGDSGIDQVDAIPKHDGATELDTDNVTMIRRVDSVRRPSLTQVHFPVIHLHIIVRYQTLRENEELAEGKRMHSIPVGRYHGSVKRDGDGNNGLWFGPRLGRAQKRSEEAQQESPWALIALREYPPNAVARTPPLLPAWAESPGRISQMTTIPNICTPRLSILIILLQIIRRRQDTAFTPRLGREVSTQRRRQDTAFTPRLGRELSTQRRRQDTAFTPRIGRESGEDFQMTTIPNICTSRLSLLYCCRVSTQRPSTGNRLYSPPGPRVRGGFSIHPTAVARTPPLLPAWAESPGRISQMTTMPNICTPRLSILIILLQSIHPTAVNGNRLLPARAESPGRICKIITSITQRPSQDTAFTPRLGGVREDFSDDYDANGVSCQTSACYHHYTIRFHRVFSFPGEIIHPYYTIAEYPPNAVARTPPLLPAWAESPGRISQMTTMPNICTPRLSILIILLQSIHPTPSPGHRLYSPLAGPRSIHPTAVARTPPLLPAWAESPGRISQMTTMPNICTPRLSILIILLQSIHPTAVARTPPLLPAWAESPGRISQMTTMPNICTPRLSILIILLQSIHPTPSPGHRLYSPPGPRIIHPYYTVAEYPPNPVARTPPLLPAWAESPGRISQMTTMPNICTPRLSILIILLQSIHPTPSPGHRLYSPPGRELSILIILLQSIHPSRRQEPPLLPAGPRIIHPYYIVAEYPPNGRRQDTAFTPRLGRESGEDFSDDYDAKHLHAEHV
ncbi:hypothetical protein J6590_075936 [Homalodisca vitripennis]|nr:hypothetical protein J6590_075936 [Homalodisca vitripennis]